MKFVSLEKGRFRTRENRFSAIVRINDEDRLVYVPNTGRLKELFQPCTPCFLSYQPSISRKTEHDLLLVSSDFLDLRRPQAHSNLVCIDSRISPLLVWESLWEGLLSEFRGYEYGFREVNFGDSRLDLAFDRFDGRVFVEVKSVNLVRNRRALFPDAPTLRGRRHIKTLVKAVQEGNRAAIVFVVQRSDADSFSVNYLQDPEFASMLQWGIAEGVEVYAYKCAVTVTDIRITSRIPVDWN